MNIVGVITGINIGHNGLIIGRMIYFIWCILPHYIYILIK